MNFEPVPAHDVITVPVETPSARPIIREWHCCLFGDSNPNALRFSITAGLSCFIMLFSAVMLAFMNLPCPEQNTFVGLITLVLGYWLKSPLD